METVLERSLTMTSNATSEQLRSSILSFAMLAAILSSLIAYVMSAALPNFAGLAIAAIPATILSSILFWWLFIVRPQRVSIVRGMLAGIVSIISALVLMWLFMGPYFLVTQQIPDIFLLLAAAIGFTFIICVSPLGWVFFAIGGIAGGLLARHLERSIFPKTNIEQQTQEALSML